MKPIPKFIDPIQRVSARVMRVAKIDPQAAAAADGAFPVDHFGPGLAVMDEEDWRQLRMTPENAVRMADGVNAAVAAGKQVRGNYAHDRSGPISAQVVRAEVTAGGGVRSFVKWTERAQAAIRPDANGVREYEGTSPEFYARVVLDQDGHPVEENGRVLMEPYELVGFALDNDPAMPDLAIAANRESDKEDQIMTTKELAAMLGLDPEKATEAEVRAEAAKRLAKPEPAPAPTPASAVDVQAIATAVLAQLDPKKLASEIGEAAKSQALETLRAEQHEKAVVATVDAAIRAGRVKKSERDAALKLAKADLESFKTMTAAMKVVAPVASVYVPGDLEEASLEGADPKEQDAALTKAALELQAERKKAGEEIGVLEAARRIVAGRQK